VGGSYERNGVSAVAWNGGIWVAETSTQGCSGVNGHSDCPVMISNNLGSGGGSSIYFSVPAPAYSTYFVGGQILGNSNPALLAVGTTLYLAVNDSYGSAYIFYSTDGSNFNGTLSGNWTQNYLIGYSPSLALDSSSNTLYVGYWNSETYNPILCSANASTHTSNGCQNLTGLRTMNFNPGIAVYDGLLYMGFEDRGDSHCLYFYKYTPSTNGFAFWNPLNCGEQTSSAPSLATHNGELYVAFRTNDSSQKFTVRVSTTGNDLGYRQQPGFSTDGPPDLFDMNLVGVNEMQEFQVNSHVLNTSIGTP